MLGNHSPPLGSESLDPAAGRPSPQEPPIVGYEALVLVRWKRGTNGVDEKVVELLGLYEAEHDLIDVGEVRGRELLISVELEVRVCQAAVVAKLLIVGEIQAVADIEVRSNILTDMHSS